MWAIIIMITVINIIIIWMTLRSLVWGLGSDTQRGVSVQNFTFEDLSMFIFSLHLSTHFLSQGILFVDQRVKGRNYCFLDDFALLFAEPESFPLYSFCALFPSSGVLCFHTCGSFLAVFSQTTASPVLADCWKCPDTSPSPPPPPPLPTLWGPF